MKVFLNDLRSLALRIFGFLTEKSGKQSITRLILVVGMFWLMLVTTQMLERVESFSLYEVGAFFGIVSAILLTGKYASKAQEK